MKNMCTSQQAEWKIAVTVRANTMDLFPLHKRLETSDGQMRAWYCVSVTEICGRPVPWRHPLVRVPRPPNGPNPGAPRTLGRPHLADQAPLLVASIYCSIQKTGLVRLARSASQPINLYFCGIGGPPKKSEKNENHSRFL